MAGRPHIEIKKDIHPQIAQMYADLTELQNNLRKSAKSVDQKSILLTSFCCGSLKISSLNTGLAMSSKISSVGKGLVADLVGHGFYFTLSKRTFCVIHLKST